MSVPKEFAAHVVGYECFIYECTHIICCMRWWSSISSNSMFLFDCIPPNSINVFYSIQKC